MNGNKFFLVFLNFLLFFVVFFTSFYSFADDIQKSIIPPQGTFSNIEPYNKIIITKDDLFGKPYEIIGDIQIMISKYTPHYTDQATIKLKQYAFSMGADKDILIVGHLPFLSYLATYLLLGQKDKAFCDFQEATVLWLERQSKDKNYYLVSSNSPCFME